MLLREQAITPDGMEAALKEGQFVIYLQLQGAYRIQDHQPAGARRDPAEPTGVGLPAPAEFIPFEKTVSSPSLTSSWD